MRGPPAGDDSGTYDVSRSADVSDFDAEVLKRIVTEAGCVLWHALVARSDAGDYDWKLRVVLSEPARRWMGIPAGQAPRGEDWSSCFHPEDVKAMEDCYISALEKGESGYEQDFRMVGKDGQVHWLRETVEIRPVEDGVWDLYGVAVDNTERKEADEALRASEQQFRAVWENSFEAMRLTDAAGRIVTVNPAFCRLTGMKAEEVAGRYFTEVFLEPEFDADEALAIYRRQFADGTLPQFLERAIRLVGEAGREMCIDASVSYVRLSGQSFCLTVMRDATERERSAQQMERSEALFRSIWENSNDGMRLTDEEGRILAVNEAYCRLLEMSEEELVGSLFVDSYQGEESRRRILENYRDYWAENTGSHRVERQVKLRSGRVANLDVSISEIEPRENRRVFLAVVRDNTGIRQSEEKRLTLERKMLEAQRLESLGVLAGGIAHDFNNLLTAVLGNASLALLQLPGSSTIRPFLESIEKTSLQAADLCKQMLAYSGHGRIQFRKICLNALLKEMDHLLRVSIHKQIVLKLRLAEQIPAVQADPSQIQQVIMNLTINASEAIGGRSGVITISTGVMRIDRNYWDESVLTPEMEEGDYVYVEVADNGCGMDEQTRERIFDPFFTTKFTGRGLGMAAVLGIVQRHRGAFKVYSERDEGTTVKALFPAAEGESEGRGDDRPDSERWKARGTVLVADDEQSVRAVTARTLESFGLTALLARDGAEAIAIYERHADEIDLVLLDMTMPEVGGEEAFREIRKRNAEVPVLLMSGYTESDAMERFAGKGLAGFIQKPFGRKIVEEALRKIFPEKKDG